MCVCVRVCAWACACVRVHACMWLCVSVCVTSVCAWHDEFKTCSALYKFIVGSFGCAMTMHMCDITHTHVWHDSFTCVTWLFHVCSMTHACMLHNLYTCVTLLFHICDMTLSRVCVCMHVCDCVCVCVKSVCAWHDEFKTSSTLYKFDIWVCDDHANVWHESYVCVACYFHMWRDSFTRVILLMHMCDLTHTHAWHDSFSSVTWL